MKHGDIKWDDFDKESIAELEKSRITKLYHFCTFYALFAFPEFDKNMSKMQKKKNKFSNLKKWQNVILR